MYTSQITEISDVASLKSKNVSIKSKGHDVPKIFTKTPKEKIKEESEQENSNNSKKDNNVSPYFRENNLIAFPQGPMQNF